MTGQQSNMVQPGQVFGLFLIGVERLLLSKFPQHVAITGPVGPLCYTWSGSTMRLHVSITFESGTQEADEAEGLGGHLREGRIHVLACTHRTQNYH